MMKICSECKEEVVKLKKKNPAVCQKCYDKYYRSREVCSKCGCLKVVKTRKSGQVICGTCYYKTYIQPMRNCSQCGKLSALMTHNLCNKCYYKQNPPKKRKCSGCGENRTISLKGKDLCFNCYRKQRIAKTHLCALCKRMEEGQLKGKYGYLCQWCVRMFRDKGKCIECGEVKVLTKNFCSSCYNKQYKRKKIFCISCRQVKDSYTKILNFPVCMRCHRRFKYQNDECFRLKSLLRSRLIKALKLLNLKENKFKISFNAIIQHLGPCPGKREDYHVDHIIPLCAFNLANEKHLIKAFAPENHQWLKIKDNLSKGGFYNFQDFKMYMEKS